MLKAGFSVQDATPPLGIAINGYFVPRRAEGVRDPLELCCLALSVGEETAVICTLDNLGIPMATLQPMKERVSAATGLKQDAIWLHCTHSHTAGAVGEGEPDEIELNYREKLVETMIRGIREAVADLAPCRVGYGIGQAPNSAFVRRYRMRDGSIRTNPGVGNPEVLCAVGEADERVGVLRFQREKDDLVLVHFANHPDTVGGNLLSADWPGFVRRETERALPQTRVLFLNGCQGDVNHVKVFAQGGDLNGMENDFDDVFRGYDHARYLGRVVAGAVLQVFDKVCFTEVDRLICRQKNVRVPSNMPSPDQLPQARLWAAYHEAGEDHRIPYEGMMLTTVVAQSLRMLALEHGPEFFDLPLSLIVLGKIALMGLPGEPFTDIGRALKAAEGWEMVLPSCCTNAYEGYFPMRDSYEGGYEAATSRYCEGVAEKIIEEGLDFLKEYSPFVKD